MYFFLTTPIPGPTTERWFGKEPGDYYYFNGGPHEYWETERIEFFDEETEQKTIEKSEILDHIFYFIGLFSNTIHLVILTRKELRTNVVFIIILGICISDILVSTAGITEKYFGNSEEKAVYEGFCGTDWQYMMVVFDVFSQRIQKFGRLSSTLLALSTAVIRALTVLFPMSSMIDKLLKKRSAYIIVLVIWMLCVIRIVIDQFKYGIIIPGTHPRSCYTSAERIFQDENRLLEGYTVLTVTIIYTVVTFLLLIALGIARKKRKALNTDKSSGTSLLVVIMSLSFLVSEFLYSMFFILDTRFEYNGSVAKKQLSNMFEHVSKLVLTVNSILHCLICFFLSSQYREAAKKLFCIKQKKSESVLGPATNSVDVRSARENSDY